MATTDTFQCSVITPERPVLECDATFVAFPAHDGEMGALVNRGPMVCKLGIGALRIHTPDEKYLLFIDGGFAQVVDNQLSILTRQAKKPEEIDSEAAQRSLIEARSMPTATVEAVEARGEALKRVQMQLKIARS